MSNLMDNSTNHKEQLKKALIAVQKMRIRLQEIESPVSRPIAIIGMGCRFPGGADSPEDYWHLLKSGKDGIKKIPQFRWNNDDYYDPKPATPGKTYARHGGFIENIDHFDAQFFGISPLEAVSLDPQQRLLLEVAWDALEDACQPTNAIFGSRTGVFVGVTTNDYARLLALDGLETINAYTLSGNALNFGSGRISYFFGWNGPSLAIDTACSSSLVSLHLACQSLRSHECNMALAGGVNAILVPDGMIAAAKLGVLAHDGQGKTFDARADGFVRGEGCGVLVLKRLHDALDDGDPIRAIIRGSAVNQDGRTSGFTVPSVKAQQRVVREALTNAGIHPNRVDYVEAHGTGTILGDPIEVRALVAALCEQRSPDKPLIVGSVKTNIGHLEAAAGVAGVIKVVLCLEHKKIPPIVNLVERNPNIEASDSQILFPRNLLPWDTAGETRVAGVSSFGASGTNAHVILEEAPQSSTRKVMDFPPHILPISAHNLVALRAMIRSYLSWLRISSKSNYALADICYTASARRTHHKYRLAIVGESTEEIEKQLSLADENKDGRITSSIHSKPKLAFVLPGMEAQLIDISNGLFDHEPVFRSAFEECDETLGDYLGWSVKSTCTKRSQSEADRIETLQPVLFSVQVGLSALWQSWGIQPDGILGCSGGEITAAYIAGCLTLEDAARIISRNTSLMKRSVILGGTVSVNLPANEMERMISDVSLCVSIAAIITPTITVVSGKLNEIENVVRLLEERRIRFRWLSRYRALHSQSTEPSRSELDLFPIGITPRVERIPLYSSMMGQRVEGIQLDLTFWDRHLNASMDFVSATRALYQAGYTAFLELSPRATLTRALMEILGDYEKKCVVLESLDPEHPTHQTLHSTLARLYSLGFEVEWGEKYLAKGNCVRLPSYPWQRERFWINLASINERAHDEDHLKQEDQRDSESTVNQLDKKRSIQLVDRFSLSREKLVTQRANEQKNLLTTYLQKQVGIILGIPSSKLDDYQQLKALGMDSLMATSFKNRIESDIGVDLPISILLEGVTIEQLARRIAQELSTTSFSSVEMPLPSLPDPSRASPVEEMLLSGDVGGDVLSPKERQELAKRLQAELQYSSGTYPLSYSQQHFWLLHQLDPNGAAYNVPMAIRFNGPLDADVLEKCLSRIIGRHEILRSTYGTIDRQQFSIVRPPTDVRLDSIHLSEKSDDSKIRQLRDIMNAEARRPFDLVDGPIVRATLIRLGAEKHVLLVVMHHIACDGVSVGILARELFELYEAIFSGNIPSLPDLSIQYNDFARWQREVLQEEVLRNHIVYWQNQLAGAPTSLQLPYDHPRPLNRTNFSNVRSLNLPGSLVEDIARWNFEQGVTLFVTLLTALKILLYRWTRQKDIVVGTVFANRASLTTEHLIGCFVNFVALRLTIADAESGHSLLNRVKATVINSMDHLAVPFEKVVSAINPNRLSDHSPLYNVALILHNYEPWQEVHKFQIGDRLEARYEEVKTGVSLLDLRIVVRPTSEGLRVECEYAQDLFDDATIDKFLRSYEIAIQQLTEHPETLLSDFDLVEV